MTTDTLDFPPVDTAALDHAQAKADWMASQQLAIIETGVAELTPTARALAELEHRLKGIAYPALNTGAGMQAAIDDRRTLIDLRVGLGKLVEAANKKDRADTKARCEQRDAGCLKLTTAIKALEEPIDQQIKAEEARKAEEKRKRDAAEAERKAKHQSGIDRIRAYVVKAGEPGMTSERIAIGIAQLEAIPTPTSETWEEFAVPAADAICETLAKMRLIHAACVDAERVRKENEELRAKLAAADAAPAVEQPRAQEEAPHQQAAGDSPTGSDRTGRGIEPQVATPDEKPTLKLGDLNDWLGGPVTTSAAGLLLLGITHSGTDKAAKLYKPSDKARIKAALVEWLQGLR